VPTKVSERMRACQNFVRPLVLILLSQAHISTLFSLIILSLIEGMCFSLSCVLLSRSSLWILPLIFFNLFLQGCLSEVGVVSNAVYIGGGHGGFESTRDRVDLRLTPHTSMDLPSPGNLLPSPFSLHLSLVLLTQGPRRAAPKAPARSSVWPKL
jgi:hypothetical protein